MNRKSNLKRVINAPLVGKELNEAATILARNFQYDEDLLWLVQSQKILDLGIESYFRYLLKDAAHAKDLYVKDGEVWGVCISAPPKYFSDLNKLKDENLPFSDEEILKIFNRIQFLLTVVEEQRQAFTKTPTWRYLFLGVLAQKQGLGIGSEILQFSMQQSFEANTPIYLETSQKKNIPFYKKNGFNLAFEYDVPDQGPHYWVFSSK